MPTDNNLKYYDISKYFYGQEVERRQHWLLNMHFLLGYVLKQNLLNHSRRWTWSSNVASAHTIFTLCLNCIPPAQDSHRCTTQATNSYKSLSQGSTKLSFVPLLKFFKHCRRLSIEKVRDSGGSLIILLLLCSIARRSQKTWQILISLMTMNALHS